ncbi:hypothetical protein F5H01DRAFT_93453 [Linnemannia elongata]|nr:hypothetical protein F5H01DRAFT_93453 [Linnemannia elongata]
MSVPPRQPRLNQPPTTSSTSTSAGRSRNATATDPTTVASGSDTNPLRIPVSQQDQDSGTGTRTVAGAFDTTSNNDSRRSRGDNPFTARRRESRPDQQHRRHGASISISNNNNNNNNTTPGQMRTPATSRLPGRPPPAPRPSHITSRIPGPIQSPLGPRPGHAVARPPSENAFELPVDDPFTSRRPTATPIHLRREAVFGGGGGAQAGVGFNSSELNASPMTPWDMMFTPNTQAIETTTAVGTPVTARLTESFSSIAVTPEQEDVQEGSSSTANVSTALFIKRPSRIAFEQEEEEEGEESDFDDNDDIHPGDKVLDDDDVESFLSKRESLIRGRRAIEKRPRRLSSHTGPHDMYYSSPSVGMATPESFTTPQFRTLPPLSIQLPTRTPGVGSSRFNTSLMSREDPDTPVGRNNRDQDNDEPPSLWTNAARRAMLDLKKHVYQGESDEAQGDAHEEMSQRGVASANSQAEEETLLGTSRILPSSLIRRSEPERDPFLQTPRPERDPFNQESVRDEEVHDEREFHGDVVHDEVDLEQDFQNVAADTAFISEGHDSIAELIYEPEDLEEERRRRNEVREVIRANRSFELGLKAAREEKEAEAAARAVETEAAAAQELINANAKAAEAKVEVEDEEESEDKMLRRQLDAEVKRAMSMFDEDIFDESSDTARLLPPTSVLLTEILQERNGRQLTTPEELECRSWMYEGGRVGKPQRVGVWARV